MLRGFAHHLAQHVLQDAAVEVVIHLVEGIDAAEQRDLLRRAVGAGDGGSR